MRIHSRALVQPGLRAFASAQLGDTSQVAPGHTHDITREVHRAHQHIWDGRLAKTVKFDLIQHPRPWIEAEVPHLQWAEVQMLAHLHAQVPAMLK